MTSDFCTITRSRGAPEGRKVSASKRFSCAAAGVATSSAVTETRRERPIGDLTRASSCAFAARGA